MLEIVRAWLATEIHEDRHKKRVAKIEGDRAPVSALNSLAAGMCSKKPRSSAIVESPYLSIE